MFELTCLGSTIIWYESFKARVLGLPDKNTKPLEMNSIAGGGKCGHVKHVSEVMLPGHLDCLFLQVSKIFGLRNVPDVPQRNSKKVLIKFVSKLETKSIHTSDLIKILK